MSLQISKDLSLPVDVAGETIAILAKRGAGKTNTATVLVEELVGQGIQTVIIDPVGAWWGVRSSAKGEKGAGLPIPILGGQHGDVPLEQNAGQLIADVAVDSGQSMLIDLSDFASKAATHRFVKDFADRLYRRKARHQSLLHLVLEEADEFAPQSPRGGFKGDTGHMAAAIEQIVRRGRGRGLGVTLITQRSAVLNKDVLTQADVLVVMRTTGPQDVKAIRDWVNARGDEKGDEVIRSLPGLVTGEAWFWNPERDLLRVTKVRRRRTFDSSSTPKAGLERQVPVNTVPIDLSRLGEQIEQTAERAKENDPAVLRGRIRELERKATAEKQAPEIERVEKIVEKPVFTAAERKLIDRAVKAVEKAGEAFALLGPVLQKIPGPELPTHVVVPAAGRPAQAGQPPQKIDYPQRRPVQAAKVLDLPKHADLITFDNGKVSVPQQKILDALAWFETIGVDSPRRPPLAAVAGVSSKSSGFRANVSTLSGKGLIQYPGDGRVTLTDEGRELAIPPDRPASVEELHDAICRMVSNPQAALLRVLLRMYPSSITREELAERASVSAASSGFRANVSTLSGFELIVYPMSGMVRAADLLFPEGA